MIKVNKMLHEIYDADTLKQFFSYHWTKEKLKRHSLKLVAQHFKIKIRRNCFSVRVVVPNLLRQLLIPRTFESRLDKVWSHQPDYFLRAFTLIIKI